MAAIINKAKVAKLRKEERQKFVGSFAQAKNLIENQLKVGYHIKMQKQKKDENKDRV
jgi:hypothetical protein